MKAVSFFGFVAMVAGLVGLLFTRQLFSPSPVVIGLQVAAGALMVWARVALGMRSFHATAAPTEGRLVTSGPYRYVRNPIYSAVVLFVAAGAAAHPSLFSAGMVVITIAGAVARSLCEEQMLRETYPEYAEYAARTKRLVPFVF